MTGRGNIPDGLYKISYGPPPNFNIDIFILPLEYGIIECPTQTTIT
jgi:hypothetical protein